MTADLLRYPVPGLTEKTRIRKNTENSPDETLAIRNIWSKIEAIRGKRIESHKLKENAQKIKDYYKCSLKSGIVKEIMKIQLS